jgi:hypothetical protein
MDELNHEIGKSDLVLEGVLSRVFGDTSEINDAYMIVIESEQETSNDSSIVEFYSEKLEGHIIMFDEGGNTAHMHNKLHEKGINLFPEISYNHHDILIVPEGARNLSSLLPLITRNIDSYKGIFVNLGNSIRKLNDTGYGLPSGRNVFSQFAIATDMDTRSGSSVFFCPPYSLDDKLNLNDLLFNIEHYLINKEEFDELELKIAMESIESGITSLG